MKSNKPRGQAGLALYRGSVGALLRNSRKTDSLRRCVARRSFSCWGRASAAFALLCICAFPIAGAQLQQAQNQQGALPLSQNTAQPQAAAPAVEERLRPNYMLGPGDQIQVRAPEAEEIGDRPYRVDGDGYINLPLIGRVQAGGRTIAQLETDLVALLRKYVVRPQVIVTVVQFRSEPVFFVGAFKSPGIYPLQGRRTLVEMLSQIGGLLPNASRRIKVARRKEFGAIPLPSAVESVDGKMTTAEISLGSLRENVNPAEDIALQPFDVVTVERAEMVYVNGEVARVGGIELGERESVSIAQVITIAGGLTPNAKPGEARILRPVLSTARRAELPVNIDRILAGKDSDFPLLPNDLLYIPKKAGNKQNIFKAMQMIAVPLVPTLIYVLAR